MIKNMLTRRRESGNYLATLTSPLAAPANTGISLPLQLMKATVLTESYNILSIFIMICLLQRCLLPGRCRSLFFL